MMEESRNGYQFNDSKVKIEEYVSCSLVDVVTDRIRSNIFSGKYLPGKKLVVREISEELGVSHTPVKDTLNRLVSEGCVVASPRRSMMVKEYSNIEFIENYEIRLMIELYHADEVIAHAKAAPEIIGNMKKYWSVMEDMLAEKAPVGSGGLLWLPYLSGEQSPIWNPDAKGMFFGIGLESDYSAFVRSVMEGVAFSQKDCMDVVLSESAKPEIIPLGGGAANSPVWCQIFADVLNVPVSSLVSNETETLGDMIIAAQAVGIKEIPVDFGKTMAKSGRVFYPKPENVAVYSCQFEKYKKLYQTVKPLFA